MNVRLPDGTIVQNVPDDMTKDQFLAKAAANGFNIPSTAAPAAPPPPAVKPMGDQETAALEQALGSRYSGMAQPTTPTPAAPTYAQPTPLQQYGQRFADVLQAHPTFPKPQGDSFGAGIARGVIGSVEPMISLGGAGAMVAAGGNPYAAAAFRASMLANTAQQAHGIIDAPTAGGKGEAFAGAGTSLGMATIPDISREMRWRPNPMDAPAIEPKFQVMPKGRPPTAGTAEAPPPPSRPQLPGGVEQVVTPAESTALNLYKGEPLTDVQVTNAPVGTYRPMLFINGRRYLGNPGQSHTQVMKKAAADNPDQAGDIIMGASDDSTHFLTDAQGVDYARNQVGGVHSQQLPKPTARWEGIDPVTGAHLYTTPEGNTGHQDSIAAQGYETPPPTAEQLAAGRAKPKRSSLFEQAQAETETTPEQRQMQLASQSQFKGVIDPTLTYQTPPPPKMLLPKSGNGEKPANLGKAEPQEAATNKAPGKKRASPVAEPQPTELKSLRYTIRPNGRYDISAQGMTDVGTIGMTGNLTYEQLVKRIGQQAADLIAGHKGAEPSQDAQGYKYGKLTVADTAKPEAKPLPAPITPKPTAPTTAQFNADDIVYHGNDPQPLSFRGKTPEGKVIVHDKESGLQYPVDPALLSTKKPDASQGIFSMVPGLQTHEAGYARAYVDYLKRGKDGKEPKLTKGVQFTRAQEIRQTLDSHFAPKATKQPEPMPDDKGYETDLPTTREQDSITRALAAAEVFSGQVSKQRFEQAYLTLRTHADRLGIKVPGVGTYFSQEAYRKAGDAVAVAIGRKYGTHPTAEMRAKRDALVKPTKALPAPAETAAWSEATKKQQDVLDNYTGDKPGPPGAAGYEREKLEALMWEDVVKNPDNKAMFAEWQKTNNLLREPRNRKLPAEAKPKPLPAPITPKATAKQPWEMTSLEYRQSKGYRGLEETAKGLKEHRYQVLFAVQDGKPVPPEVLADYPDLAKPPKAAKVTPQLPPPLPPAAYKATPPAAIKPDASNAVDIGVQKENLLAQIDKAIASAPAEGKGKLTFNVPGDGAFTVFDDKASLEGFRGTVTKRWGKGLGEAKGRKPYPAPINEKFYETEGERLATQYGGIDKATEIAKRQLEAVKSDPKAYGAEDTQLKHWQFTLDALEGMGGTRTLADHKQAVDLAQSSHDAAKAAVQAALDSKGKKHVIDKLSDTEIEAFESLRTAKGNYERAKRLNKEQETLPAPAAPKQKPAAKVTPQLPPPLPPAAYKAPAPAADKPSQFAKTSEHNGITMTLIGDWQDLAAYYRGSDGNAWSYANRKWSSMGDAKEFIANFEKKARGRLFEKPETQTTPPPATTTPPPPPAVIGKRGAMGKSVAEDRGKVIAKAKVDPSTGNAKPVNKVLKVQKEHLAAAVDKALSEAEPHETALTKDQMEALNTYQAIHTAGPDFKKTDKKGELIKLTFDERQQIIADHEAAKNEQRAKLPWVRIEVPGDGNFEILDTTEALAEFKATALKQFRTSLPTATKPGVPSMAGSPVTKVETPAGPIDAIKIVSRAASTDETRFVLNSVLVKDGELVATDGRRLMIYKGDKAPKNVAKPYVMQMTGKGNKKTFKKDTETTYDDETEWLKKLESFNKENAKWKAIKDNKAPQPIYPARSGYPAFTQVIPKETAKSLKFAGLDTAPAIKMLDRAEPFRPDKGDYSVNVYRAKDGTFGIFASYPELGEYNSVENVTKGKFVGAYNPDYLRDGFEAARQFGYEKLDFYAEDELSPAVLKSTDGKFMYVLMPMRMR